MRARAAPRYRDWRIVPDPLPAAGWLVTRADETCPGEPSPYGLRANLSVKVLDCVQLGRLKGTELRTFRWEVSL